MADYTYATSSGKTYEEKIKEEQERAETQSKDYAEKEKAANETYAATMTGIHDSNVKAQEETAAADIKKTHKSYNADFDANAASELARRRALKEQMASYGLGQSGFNATNQTALAVARNRADANTRTARQQAVDTINEELRKYKAESASKLAETLANSERESATRVLANDQELQNAVHQNAVDQMMLGFEDRTQQREDMKAQTEKENLQKAYVDDHNLAIYERIYDAYNSGNTALAEEYAKQLWQIDENGNVVPMAFDTAAASKYTNERVDKNDELNKTQMYYQYGQDDDKDEAAPLYIGVPKEYESTVTRIDNDIANYTKLMSSTGADQMDKTDPNMISLANNIESKLLAVKKVVSADKYASICGALGITDIANTNDAVDISLFN